MIEAIQRPIFDDRSDAGRRLAIALLTPRERPPLVLGLARGGVIVAIEVAKRLGANFDVLVVRKLGAPQSEELAIGAVTAYGGLYLNDEIIRWLEITPEYVERETRRQRELALNRETLYRRGRPKPEFEGREVIIIDDGLATGATVVAAARSVRSQGAESVQIAVPVGAPGSCAQLRGEADDVICLHQPEPFWAVGLFYQNFSQVTDDEVLEALSEMAA